MVLALMRRVPSVSPARLYGDNSNGRFSDGRNSVAIQSNVGADRNRFCGRRMGMGGAIWLDDTLGEGDFFLGFCRTMSGL